MHDQTEIERALENEVYGLRLLVLAECDQEGEGCPAKRHFHQVILDPARFKAVSDAVTTPVAPPDARGVEFCHIQLGLEALPADPYELMRDFYGVQQD